jgi:transcriptional regulator with XRE-family HTH domain
MKSFGEKLKTIRETLEMTQGDVAEFSGLKPSAISHFETGRRKPGLKNIVRLCRALNCEPNALIDV